jgi:outer membrane protein
MKKALVLSMILAVAITCGCGRSAQFGVVDMNKVQTESQAFKDATKDLQTKGQALQDELAKETAGKSQEEAQKIMQDKSAKMQALQAAAQSKIKGSFEAAAAAVAKEKKLSAILVKDAVPQGGTDVTEDIIQKMK